MANNRLYIVNPEANEYVCIAKSLGTGWGLRNVEVLKNFLDNITEFDKTCLIIGTENDSEFYKKFIKEGNNANVTGKWEYE